MLYEVITFQRVVRLLQQRLHPAEAGLKLLPARLLRLPDQAAHLGEAVIDRAQAGSYNFV